MSLVINTWPGLVSFSKNRIPLFATTNKYVQTAGTKAKFTLEFTADTSSAGQSAQIDWDDNSVEMELNVVGNEEGTRFLTNGGGLPLAEYVEDSVTEDFKRNFLLNNDYNISYDGSNGVLFEARERGVAYNPSLSEDLSAASFTTQVTAVDRVYRSNFKIYVAIYVEDSHFSGSFTRIATTSQIPDENQQVEFDLMKYLAPYVEYDPPAYGQTAVAKAENAYVRWYYEIWESYGDPIVDYALTRSEVLVCIRGALNKEAFPQYLDDVLNQYIGFGMRFLCNKSTARYISIDSPEHLYYLFMGGGLQVLGELVTSDSGSAQITIDGGIPAWIAEDVSIRVEYEYSGQTYIETGTAGSFSGNSFVITLDSPPSNIQYLSPSDPVILYNSTSSTFKVQAFVYYTDGTSTGWHDLFTVSSCQFGEIYKLPTGPDNSGINALDPLKVVKKYLLQIEFAGGVGSQIITYTIENSSAYEHYFIYENGQGGGDTLRCYGESQVMIKTEKYDLDKPLDSDYVQTDRQLEMRPLYQQKGLKVNTGNLRKSQYDDLEEILLAQEVWHMENGMYIPGHVPADSFTFKPERDTLFNLAFEWFRSKKDLGR